MITIETPILHALALAQKGFPVFPLMPRDKKPLPNSRGFKDATIDEDVINRMYTANPNANIAIATGSWFFVVDVDTNHDAGKYGDASLAELEKINAKLPDTVEVLTGGGGRHLYFKMPEGVEIPCSAGKLGVNIDIRSSGGYVVAPPSVHPSGTTYEWEGSSDPFEGVELADAPQWLIDLVKRDTRAVMAMSASGEVYQTSEWDCMGDSEKADLLDALASCPNGDRQGWVDVGMAIHSMDATDRGFRLFAEWSQSQGYPKYDAQDAARVFTSFSNGKADKKNKETIFYIARANKWIPKHKQIEMFITAQTGNAITDDINDESVYDPSSVAKEAAIDFNFPHETRLLQQLSGIIRHTSATVSESATTQAVIALASLLASRRYVTPSGESCQLYVGISSGNDGSIDELRYTSRAIRQVLQECGLRKMARERRLTSTQQLYKTLYFSPASLYLCDDYAQMLKLSTRQTTGSMEVILNTLTGLFNEKRLQLDSKADADLTTSDMESAGDDDGKPVIERPCLSMLSLMHYSQLATFAKSSERGRGAVGQFLFAICDDDDIEFKEDADIDVQDSVIDALLKIRNMDRQAGDYSLEQIKNNLKNHTGNLRGIEPELIRVTFECDVAAYDKIIDGVTGERRNRSFTIAARKNFRRLCTILAAFNNNGDNVATKKIMDWCCTYVVFHLKRLINVLEVVSSDNGELDVGQRVVEKVFSAGAEGITQSDLARYIRPFGAMLKDKRAELLDQLESDGHLKAGVKFIKTSGRESNRVVHSNYLSKKTTD